VVDTNFPDIRRPTGFEGFGGGKGDGLVIPRERLSSGDYCTRLYVDMTEYDGSGEAVNGVHETGQANGQANGQVKGQLNGVVDLKTASKRRKAEITASAILEKGAKLMGQYRFRMKEGTQPFWWAAYSVGQRLAEKYIISDEGGMPRIFLAGDGEFLIQPGHVPDLLLIYLFSMPHALPPSGPRHEHLDARLP
jgi:phenol 2-monooxygenase